MTYHGCHIPVDPHLLIHVRQVFRDISSIHSDMEALDQSVSSIAQVKYHFPQVRNTVRWAQPFIVGPQVVVTGILAISDQRVVTITLEVIFLIVKGHIMGVTPDLAIPRSYKYKTKSDKKGMISINISGIICTSQLPCRAILYLVQSGMLIKTSSSNDF